jgi:hypothetical protein
MKKNTFLLQIFYAFTFLICFSVSAITQETTPELKTITGKVTHLNKPISNVNIGIKGEGRGTSTTNNGSYSIKAKVGDLLQYSYVGYKTVSIVVEDVTSILNITMTLKTNKLKEIVVRAKRKREGIELKGVKIQQTIQTGVGKINLQASGFDSDYVAGKDIPQHCNGVPGGVNPLICAATVSFPFLVRFHETDRPPVWDIDGAVYQESQLPYMQVSEVKGMWLLKNAAARYGSKKVIIVQTIRNTYANNKKQQDLRNKITEENKNQNFYENDAKEITTEEIITSSSISFDSKIKTKTIRGIISDLTSPLANVNVSIKDKYVGTKSDKDGKYVINAEIGDIINFNYIGFKPITVIVEDVTEILNIDMVMYANQLDEVVLKVNGKSGKSGKVLERSKKVEEEFTTSRGKFNPKTAGYSVGYVDDDEISNVYGSVLEVLQGKVAGYSIKNGEAYLRGEGMSVNQKYPAAWEVDGVFTTTPPNIDLSQIKNIRALKSLASTNKYGVLGAGGVIVIQTKSVDFGNKTSVASKNKNKFTNKNFYSEDAENVNLDLSFSNAYTNKIQEFNNKGNAYVYYLKELQNQLKDFNIQLSVAQKFISYYKDAHYSLKILKGLADKYAYHPENLKTISYLMQSIKAKKEAIDVYRKVLILRPKYAQSYRDLANAYIENEQFKMAWRLQMNYLMQGNDLTDEGIGKLLYNEMEWLYFNRKNQTLIKEKFVPNSKNAEDFKNDIRLVFEWSTSEAEFDLEFVNPQRQAYVFEHSLFANQELIFNEKKKGYSSKEFMIDNIGIGEWLVNITYLGNKKPEPTYFKLTTYYNWGKSNQTQEIRVFNFKDERKKIQLLKLNKQILVTSK